ncbi:unnamed protein product, partial [Ixodes hexagonus]
PRPWSSVRCHQFDLPRARTTQIPSDEGITSICPLVALVLLSVVVTSLVLLARILSDATMMGELTVSNTNQATTSTILPDTSTNTTISAMRTPPPMTSETEVPMTSTILPDTSTNTATATSTMKTPPPMTSATRAPTTSTILPDTSTNTSTDISTPETPPPAASTRTPSTTSTTLTTIAPMLPTPSTKGPTPPTMSSTEAAPSEMTFETTVIPGIEVVNTTHGQVAGKVHNVLNTQVVAYLGIPYADDTGGSNRFQPPKQAKPWSGVLEAFERGPSCYQPRNLFEFTTNKHSNMSEDCLSVNIWVPRCPNHTKRCPLHTVMVYFCGHDLRRGCNSVLLFDGGKLSALGDVVVVIPNYRLGVLGFLNTDVPGGHQNVGLLDQEFAMDWIKANIKAFGGLRDDFVVFGHHWGAYSAGLFLMSPLLRSKYGINKGILCSGSPLLRPRFSKDEMQRTSFANILRCELNTTKTVSCLQNASIRNLLAAQEAYPGSVGIVYPHKFLEIPPGYFMSRVREFPGIDILLTSTALEGFGEFQSSFGQANPSSVTLDAILNNVGIKAPTAQHVDYLIFQSDLRIKYKISFSRIDLRDFGAEFVGDFFYNCASLLFAQRMCQSAARVAHFIIGEKPYSWNPFQAFQSKPSHMQDVFFIFGVFLSHKPSDLFQVENWRKDAEYTKLVINLLANFAKNGLAWTTLPSEQYDRSCGLMSTVLYRTGREGSPKWKDEECDLLNKRFKYIQD